MEIYHCTKIKSKKIKDNNINPDTLKLIKEKVGYSLEHIETKDNFLSRILIEQAITLTINKWDVIKLRHL